MIRRILWVWGVVGTVFGRWFAPVVTLALFTGLSLFTRLCLWLDPLSFPRLRRARVTRPIVIVGNPRTGTTFLQRFLVDLGLGSGQPLWRMLYPSLLQQKLVRPLLPLLERVSPARHHSTVAHETSLTSVETDDASYLFRFFDGFFLYGFFLAFAERDRREYFSPEVRDTSARDFDWLEQLWIRGTLTDGRDRPVAKLFSLSARLPAFLRRFPDACVIVPLRDPLEVLPSGLSLVTGVLDKRFGYWNLPEAVRRRHLERLYDALVELMRRFHADWTTGQIPRDRVLLVDYRRLMTHLEEETQRILEFTGQELDERGRKLLAVTAEKQRAWKSEHRYDLRRFGLTAERIRSDCEFFYRDLLPHRGE